MYRLRTSWALKRPFGAGLGAWRTTAAVTSVGMPDASITEPIDCEDGCSGGRGSCGVLRRGGMPTGLLVIESIDNPAETCPGAPEGTLAV